MSDVKHSIYCLYTLLSMFLLVRHSQYYVFGNIITEYGFDQPVWGIALIPVTSVFGISFCINRRIVIKNKQSFMRLLLVLTIPIILNFIYKFDWEYLLKYSIHDVERRPPFLILIPIVVTIILYDTANKLTMGCDYFLICIGLMLLYISSNFIIYYTALMLTAVYLFEQIRPTKLFKYLPVLYISGIIIIKYLQIDRIGFLLELLLVLGFLVTCIHIVSLKLIPSLRFSMIEFYILQAILFTVVSDIIGGISSFGLIIFLCYGLFFVTGRLQLVKY